MRKRSSKGGGAQRSIQVHLMVNEEEAAMIRAAARQGIPQLQLWGGSQAYLDSAQISLPFCTKFAPLLY